MNPKTFKKLKLKGFALVVTLSLMILLTVIAVGLLTLSSISLRTATVGDANAQAFSNAKMAVILAIGELQKETGDDRRITADASITGKATQPNLVGTWTSWSPKFAANPAQTAPDYTAQKTSLFRSWLASAPYPLELKDPKWAESAVGANWVRLFSVAKNGFDLSAAPVPVSRGTFAWVVSQENTKAKINVAGPDGGSTGINVALQSQPRPSLALSSILKQPKSGWNVRANRVISSNQVQLDPDLAADSNAAKAAGADFTVHAQGLLTDAVRGGLKTDLNLGFELSEAEFAKAAWGGTPNPFRSPNIAAGFSSPSSYRGQQALFRPLVENPIVSSLTDFWPATVSHRFYAAGVPTFDHLRSFYRIPYHLYGGTMPTIAERGGDHVAVKVLGASSGSYFSPASPPPARASTLSIRPVFNRLIYLLSTTLGADNQVRLVLTPVISLWNPYNTALEIEGAVAYPWIDVPFQITWEIQTASGLKSYGVAMSRIMGSQFEPQGHGRSVNPYFLCEMTANGDGKITKPIRFEPGEVRVFTPSSPIPVEFRRTGSNAQRTVRMRAVSDVTQMNTKGGLAVPMRGGVGGDGFDYALQSTDSVRTSVRESSTTGQYHYFVSLEDATRIKNPSSPVGGQLVSEVQMLKFSSAVNSVASPFRTYGEIKGTTQPFGVLETFHRTARENVGRQPIADLIYTTNPRQTSINHQLSAGTFLVAPHYQSTLRSLSSLNDAIQTTVDGGNVRSFWGASHSPPLGKAQLPFFEIPREPLLSLAGFQHADLASSTFSAANQFANSWASPYLARNRTYILDTSKVSTGVPIYDHTYLTNEALWDSFFFSGAAPDLSPASSSTPANAWKAPIASVQRSAEQVLKEFVKDPSGSPLANSRMRLNRGGYSDTDLVQRLIDPAGCTRIAAHLLMDGAFNVNSTNVEAWVALLAGLRGESFQVEGGNPPSSAVTAFPRFRHPTGKEGDNWNGFRSLGDTQLRTLAENLVNEIRLRGPFLSLGEFVNRRVENTDLGRAGAIQAAINAGRLNDQSKQASFSTASYPRDAQGHIITDTGVGIPGYLTQADVLQSLAPVITCRSDTFTIRGYGETKDASGKVLARAWCEAVVQRMPEFVDSSDPADSAIASAKTINQTFGRRFEIVSFRRVPSAEIQ